MELPYCLLSDIYLQFILRKGLHFFSFLCIKDTRSCFWDMRINSTWINHISLSDMNSSARCLTLLKQLAQCQLQIPHTICERRQRTFLNQDEYSLTTMKWEYLIRSKLQTDTSPCLLAMDLTLDQDILHDLVWPNSWMSNMMLKYTTFQFLTPLHIVHTTNRGLPYLLASIKVWLSAPDYQIFL
jgi:hypothetical protein